MKRNRFLILVNDRARTGRRTAARLHRLLPDGDYTVRRLFGPPLPPAASYGRVVVVGGDGAVRHLVPHLVGARSVAIVPAGTGNNLSKALGIPQQLEGAAALAAFGSTLRRLDVLEVAGTAGTVNVVTHAALGFAAKVAAGYSRLRGTVPGRVMCYPWGEGVYRLLSLLELAVGDWPEHRMQIDFEDRTVKLRAAGLFVGNHAGIGGRFFPCPGAEPDDGVIHICTIGAPRSRAAAMRIMRNVAGGSHALSPELPRGPASLEVATSHPELVRLWRSRGPVTVSFPGRIPRYGLLADGDLFPVGCRLDLRLVRRRLAVVVPGGRFADLPGEI